MTRKQKVAMVVAVIVVALLAFTAAFLLRTVPETASNLEQSCELINKNTRSLVDIVNRLTAPVELGAEATPEQIEFQNIRNDKS